MVPTERPLDNPINWSFRAGRVWGIDVHIHVTFVLGAIVLLWMEMPRPGVETALPFSTILGDALATYAILFGIVLLHELGHCWGARRTGGEADQILLWPLGGLASVHPPHQPRAHLITTLAGPMVNVALCAACSGVLAFWTGTLGAVPWNPLHPTTPVDPTVFPTTGQTWVLRVYGTSYFLLLVNLLPIFPFDGGRMVQAGVWSRKGYRAATELATATGMAGAIAIGLFGLFTEQSWLFVMIAVFGYITCWQTRQMLREQPDFAPGEYGAEVSGGFSSTREARRARRPGFWKRLRARRAAALAEHERRKREAHEQALEEVLGKVSRCGLSSLTPRERRILEEETLRQRSLSSEVSRPDDR